MSTHETLRIDERGDAGFSILELLVAIAALATVLSAFAYSFRNNLYQIDHASVRLSTDNLARSLPSLITSRTANGISNDLSDHPELKVNVQAIYPAVTAIWQPYKITIHRYNEKNIEFSYETVRLMRVPGR